MWFYLNNYLQGYERMKNIFNEVIDRYAAC